LVTNLGEVLGHGFGVSIEILDFGYGKLPNHHAAFFWGFFLEWEKEPNILRDF